MAASEHLDAILCPIDSGNDMAQLREEDGCGEADIACPDHCDGRRYRLGIMVRSPGDRVAAVRPLGGSRLVRNDLRHNEPFAHCRYRIVVRAAAQLSQDWHLTGRDESG